jgi:dCTP deaminase
MLTDGEIKDLIKRKSITIKPYDEKCIKAGKYDIHLGRYILVPEEPLKLINPADSTIQPSYKRKDITKKGYILEPGKFILGQTLEVIGLSSDVGMFIDGSTTMARLGLTIHLSSSFIPPGQDPHIITLEIFNAGIWKIKLTHNLRIGKLIMFKYQKSNMIEAKTFNKYNGQKEPIGAVIKKNNQD